MKYFKKDVEIAFKEMKNDKELFKKFFEKYPNVSKRKYNTFLRNETELYFSDFNPYLDKRYLDMSYITSGNRIINLEDLYCLIRDDIMEDVFDQTIGM